MKNIVNFSQYIKEAEETEEPITTQEESEIVAYEDLKKAILDMVEASISSTDKKLTTDFLNSYIKDEEKTLMIGFVNDSDIYDFYIKYTDIIDQLLIDIDYFDVSPSQNNILSLYTYIVFSTKKAVKRYISTMLKSMV